MLVAAVVHASALSVSRLINWVTWYYPAPPLDVVTAKYCVQQSKVSTEL